MCTATSASTPRAACAATGSPRSSLSRKGDATAAEQIAHELLVSRYATVFDELNPRVSALIRNFKGTSAELQGLISTFLTAEEFIRSMADASPWQDYRRWLGRLACTQITRGAERNSSALDAAAGGCLRRLRGRRRQTSPRQRTQYYQAQVQLGDADRADPRGHRRDVREHGRNIRLSGPRRPGEVRLFQKEAESLMQQLMASGDPEQIRRYAERINDDINSAFGLLSPEEQAAMSGTSRRLARVNKRRSTIGCRP
jgi:hypothetical protein